MDNYRKYFIRFIKENYPNDYNYILTETDNHYKIISPDTAFAKTSKNPIDKRLDFSSYFLALIKALDGKGESFENIRKICLQITIEFVQPKNRVQEFFKRLLPKLTFTRIGQVLIKAFHKRVSINTNPDGFVANIITDKEEHLDLDMVLILLNVEFANYSKSITIRNMLQFYARSMKSLLGWQDFNLYEKGQSQTERKNAILDLN